MNHSSFIDSQAHLAQEVHSPKTISTVDWCCNILKDDFVSFWTIINFWLNCILVISMFIFVSISYLNFIIIFKVIISNSFIWFHTFICTEKFLHQLRIIIFFKLSISKIGFRLLSINTVSTLCLEWPQFHTHSHY